MMTPFCKSCPIKMSWRILSIVYILMVSVRAFSHDGSEGRPSRKIIDEILSWGYPIEEHKVTTQDGYILGVHRIPYGKDGPSEARRPVAFLMHGLLGASSNFIALGVNSIALNLVDAGFDVWMGNARGNIYSRAHVSLNPSDSTEKIDFFDFTWEEIALIDVPTMVDYVLAHTGEDKVHFVGHSQGGTVFLVLNSMKPEYNEKFASAHLLAGVGNMANFPNAPLRALAQMVTPIYALALRMGLVEVSLDALPTSLPPAHKASDYCFGDVKYKEFCDLMGLDVILDETTVYSLYLGGASLKQFAHYGQNIKDKTFRRWDHGVFRNLLEYGSFSPPTYDLSRVTVDVTMHYTISDVLLDENDVKAMVEVLPNAVARKVARDSFRHVHFISSPDVKELVTDYIIDRLKGIERI